MRTIFKSRRTLLTMTLTAVSIAAISFTGCRAAGDRPEETAPTAPSSVPETDAVPDVTVSDAAVPDDAQPERPDDRTAGGGHDESRPSDLAAPLTLDKVLELAQKGEELSWKDLEGYAHTDVGSGLYILLFEIDDRFSLLMGGVPDALPMYVRLVSVQDPDLYIDIRQEDVRSFIDQVRAADKTSKTSTTKQCVDIPAHIKEIHEDAILIRSDADSYPGAFMVSNAQEAAGTDTLTEGARIRIRMEDLQKKDAQGLPCYRAENIMVLDDGSRDPGGNGVSDGENDPEQDEPDIAHTDILLTSAPILHLGDPLSSTLNSFDVSSGSYTWTVTAGGQAQSVVACGADPLDTAAREDVPRLALPRYNGMDHVLYSFYTTISPDILTIRQWDSAANAAKEQVSITCYEPLHLIELEAGKIYEISLGWEERSADQNGFYGTASYVFVTE